MWPGNLSFDLHNSYALFRKSVTLARVPRKARTRVTADQSYRMWVNGHYVCRGPARGFQRSWPCDEIDLAPWLRAGENVIAIRAHNPGFSNYQYVFSGFAGVLFMGHWDSGPGDEGNAGGLIEVASDASWRCRCQSGIKRDTQPSSFQLFSQEHVDNRAESDDWMRPGFDAELSDAERVWRAPALSSAWNCEPWHALEPRGIPLLTEAEIVPLRLLGRGTGMSTANCEHTRNVVEVARRELLVHDVCGEADAACLCVPAGAAHEGRGFHSYLLDFGHTVVGNLRLRIKGARGGEIIDALFTETIERDETLRTVAPHLHQTQVSLGSRLICRPGGNDHEFYHPYGFRYLVLRVRAATVALEIEPTLRTIAYPLGEQGRFSSSDEALNRIWQACVRTQRVCSLDAYVDTPWREQAQWWGDARVQAWNTFHLVDDPRLLRRGLRCIARQATPDGLTYGHAPTMAHHCILPDFSLIWVITLWDDYWQTGSLEMFRDPELRCTLAGIWRYFRHWTDTATGLVRFDARHWLFLDWAGLVKTGQPALLSLWLLMALQKTAELHARAGEAGAAEELHRWSVELTRGLLRLRDPEDGLLRDGYSEDGVLLPQKSIHTQTLALMTGLHSSVETRAAAMGVLRQLVSGSTPPAPATAASPSIYWLTYVFSALDTRGGADEEIGREIVAYIRRYWLPMAEHGTTWSQLKDYGGDQSHSHAWSAHPLYHLMQIVGGIRQAAPGWAKVEFRPCFWGGHADVRLPTPRGLIQVKWHRQSDARCRVEIRLPVDVEARVFLPGVDETVKGGTCQWVVSFGVLEVDASTCIPPPVAC